jgi:hypothetical protein
MALFPVPFFLGHPADAEEEDSSEEPPMDDPAEDPAAKHRKYKELSDFERVSIVVLREASKLPWRKIGGRVGRDHTTCHKFYQHWQKTQELVGHRGRPIKYGADEVLKMIDAVKEDTRQSIRAAANAFNPGREWIRDARHRNGYHYYDAIPVPPLKPEAMRARVAFCREQIARIKTGNNLPVVFSDESMIRVSEYRGGLWRKKGEILNEMFYEVEQHPECKMVWGAITFADGVAVKIGLLACPENVNNASYLDMLLTANVFKFLIDEMGDSGFYWQQDNAPAHGPAKLHIARELLVVNWPAHSPDLNPIEMVWSIIKRNLRGRKFADKEELFKAAQDEWKKIPGHVIRNLVGSFLARCEMCVKLNGACLNGHWREVHRLHHQADPEHVPENPTDIEPEQNVPIHMFP